MLEKFTIFVVSKGKKKKGKQKKIKKYKKFVYLK